MGEGFNWEQLAWTSPILVAVTAGLFALFKAVADKRVNPVDELEKVLTRYQLLVERAEARAEKSEKAEVEASRRSVKLEAHVDEWERWHEAGFPDPPGPPDRPVFDS